MSVSVSVCRGGDCRTPDGGTWSGVFGDAGGLNESTSDIFGTMVEFYAANAEDPGDYDIGEKIDIFGDGSPLRYMYEPSLDGSSYDCWDDSVPGSDPHYSSGVGNHFFFLLSEGSGDTEYGSSPTCDGSTVTGIGRDAAAQIWFTALSQYMTSTETYSQARAHTVQTATDLYGRGQCRNAGRRGGLGRGGPLAVGAPHGFP